VMVAAMKKLMVASGRHAAGLAAGVRTRHHMLYLALALFTQAVFASPASESHFSASTL